MVIIAMFYYCCCWWWWLYYIIVIIYCCWYYVIISYYTQTIYNILSIYFPLGLLLVHNTIIHLWQNFFSIHSKPTKLLQYAMTLHHFQYGYEGHVIRSKHHTQRIHEVRFILYNKYIHILLTSLKIIGGRATHKRSISGLKKYDVFVLTILVSSGKSITICFWLGEWQLLEGTCLFCAKKQWCVLKSWNIAERVSMFTTVSWTPKINMNMMIIIDVIKY